MSWKLIYMKDGSDFSDTIYKTYEEASSDSCLYYDTYGPLVVANTRHLHPQEEEQLPPLSEEEEAKHDAAWMRQMERMCCDD